jgi:aryl-alcohol dehydrogenase-like predicted oxidoreductase
MKRVLGRSGIEVSAMGLGCWAIGGPFHHGDSVVGYGEVDDRESIRAIRRALDLGITLFDTADAYGCGRSERVLGEGLGSMRHRVAIATKFGYVPDEQRRQILGEDATPDYIRNACDASLRRLGTDYIDLYQLHIHDYDTSRALEVRDALERLASDGKIRHYGWSTDDPERARLFADGAHFTSAQFGLNVLVEDPGMVAVCDALDLACINRGPLGMGLLTGRICEQTTFRSDDMRHNWDLSGERFATRIQQTKEVRDVLTAGGRSPAQGALAWIWARSHRALPIPGFKTVRQVEENVAAMEFGPLSSSQMEEVDRILGRRRSQGE